MSKLTSRKFWVSLAALFGGVATAIAGLATTNEDLTAAGVICAAISAGLYTMSEAFVDGMAASSEQSLVTTTKSVTATATDKATVQQVLAAESEPVIKAEGTE